MAYETILYEVSGSVATITFNRPEAMNATNDQFYREMQGLLRDIAEDDAVGSVILTGAGRGFCAGADLKAMNPDMPLLARRRRHRWILADILRPSSIWRSRLSLPSMAQQSVRASISHSRPTS